ncbi:MAG: hypothetical protein AB8B97_08450 [Granulosicoccus sp.]
MNGGLTSSVGPLNISAGEDGTLSDTDTVPASRKGAGKNWLKARGVAILGANGGIGSDLNTAFQATATLGLGPTTILTVARKQYPELKDVASPDTTYFSRSLAPHQGRAEDIFSTASVSMKKFPDGTLNRAGMLGGNIGLLASALVSAPEGSVVFCATNPSHPMATMVAMIRPDLTPVGHAGTDVNRAVASDQLAIKKGEGFPVIIGDHGPTMGAWNSKGDFMV